MSLSKLAATAAFLSVVVAFPQKPDFNAIAKAPTVANGPSATNGDPEQQASLYTSYTVSGPTAAASTVAPSAAKRNIEARDQVISSNVVDSGFNSGLGTVGQLTTINQGVDYWINGASTHSFFGNLKNSGRIFVSQTQYLKWNPFAIGQASAWLGHDTWNGNLQNAAGALIQLNDYGSMTGSTYNWNIRSMDNQGTIQWCGRGDTGGSIFQMYNDVTSTNNGLISFEQFSDNRGSGFVWRNSALSTTSGGQTLYNNGAFRIINVNYHNVQNVYGNGCWQIGKGGVLYLEDGTGVFQNPTGGPSFPGQSIQFQDPSGVLHMDSAVYSRSSNFGAKIYGFGQGNAIEFFQLIQSFQYNPGTGILSVAFVGGQNVNMNIGQGYQVSNFASRKNLSKYGFYNAIYYDGVAPSQSAPSQCSITAPVCSGMSGGLPPKPQPATSSTSSVSSTSKAPTPSPTSSNTGPTTAAPSTTQAPLSPKTCPYTPYTPYYPALATGYTTDPALSATKTTTAGQACATQPEAGTYCGFINPLDPCAPQPDGYGPVPTPDTPSAFLAFSQLHSSASAAPTVIPSNEGTQYTQVFKDLNGATSAQSYLGLYTLQKYNASECAAKCDCTELCTAFNLFAERAPSLRPSTNDTAPTVWGNYCPNPPSQTEFKCTLWGSNIDASTATNTGQTREQFQVVITASDGWDKTNVTVPPNPAPNPSPYQDPKDCKGKAIDAPQYWLGSRFFPGPFNPLICATYASDQSAVNKKAGAAPCSMYNAYYLHKNGKPFGTQCSLYNSILDSTKWGTYSGEVLGGDKYDCKQSWTYAIRV